MKTLFRALGEDAAVQKIQEAFQKTDGRTLVYGLSGSQKHAVYASAFDVSPRPTVVLVQPGSVVMFVLSRTMKSTPAFES